MKNVKLLLILVISLFMLAACEEESDSKGGLKGELKDGEEKSLREENLEKEQEFATKREPCDTLSLQEYVIENFPDGQYLVEFDASLVNKTYAPAIMYHSAGGNTYVFAVIAKSKATERKIEVKNVVGYDASFKNLDSTRLGTAFFYLNLFECDGESNYTLIWEALIPIHSGFSAMKFKTWGKFKIPYVELKFIDGINSGFRNYNYFMVNGLTSPPHLLETYTTIARRREVADNDKNKWPDYNEWRFVQDDTALYVRQLDSVPFYWDTSKNLYLSKKSKRWKKKY